MATMKRWTCPKCSAGKLAPSRPRRDDTRRYCLPCSEESGRLVERVCAALEKERKEKATAVKAKVSRARSSAKEAKVARVEAKRAHDTVGGAHVPDFIAPFWKVLVEEVQKLGRPVINPGTPPPVTIRRSGPSSPPDRWTGRGSRRYVALTFGPLADKAQALQLLLHELCHGAVGRIPSEGWHGMTFRKVLRNAARRLWGVDVIIPAHRYALDDLIIVELRKLWGLPEGSARWLEHTRKVKERRAARTAERAAARVSPAESDRLAG